MGPDSEITGQTLLTAVYSQNWPAPDPTKTPLRGFRGDKRRQNATRISSAKTSRRGGLLSTEERAELMLARPSTPSLNTLDRETLKWKSWTTSNDNHDSYTDLSMYKITQDTFRKLTNQVKDVNNMMTNKFRNSGFKKYYVNSEKVTPAIHPSQLALNLRSTRPSYERYQSTEDEDMLIQSRPISRSDRTRQVSPRPMSSLLRRPHSTMSQYSTRSSSPVNEYDSLTPRIVEELGDLEKSTPFYDVAEGPFNTVKTTWSDDSGDENEKNDEENSDYENDELEKVKEQRPRIPDFSIPSDLEDYDDDIDFNESNLEEPDQEYPEPLSEPFCDMDLFYLSCLEEDWKETLEQKPEEEDEPMMERLVELERLQWLTINWENEKQKSHKKNGKQKEGVDRVQSAGLSGRYKSKNCVDDCTQPACAGDCPSKRVHSAKGCYHCKKRTCDGSCTEYGYQHFVRSPRTDSDDESTKRPKSCNSCTRKNRVQTINKNNTLLGRPKSSFATYSTAELYSVDPRRINPNGKINGAIQSADQVIISPSPSSTRPNTPFSTKSPSRPATAKPVRGAKGRDSVLSGKSYTSQRRNSITKPVSVNIVKANSRAKSARKRRPRTAKK
ncbi:uncharacterized protein LOC144437818 [Glandiceps talaboti]